MKKRLLVKLVARDSPCVDEVMRSNPYVYIKSHPKGEERVPSIAFHLSTTADGVDVAKKRVTEALVQLTELIKQKGGKITDMKSTA